MRNEGRHIAGVLITASWLILGGGVAGTALAKEGEGAAEGVNLQTGGAVEVNLSLVSVAESGVGPFDESAEVLDVDQPVPGLGGIAAGLITVHTQHQPFEHQLDSSALVAGLGVNLGLTVFELVDLDIVSLGSSTIASEAGVAGRCGEFAATGSATIEELSVSVLGVNLLDGVDVPISPPPNFTLFDDTLGLDIGIASVEAQVALIVNEQDEAADGSAISVNGLRLTIGLEASALGFPAVSQSVNLVMAQSQAGFTDCNEVDLAVEKTSSLDGNATVGEPFDYTVTIDNTSAADATVVEMTDQLPEALEFTGFVDQGGGDCMHDAGLITCRWLTIPAGAGVAVTYQVTPVAEGSATNSVSVETGDINIGDGGDSIEVIIDPADPADNLQVTVTVEPEPSVAGEPLTYTVDVVNTGTETVEDVTFELDFEGVPVTINSAEPADDCIIADNHVGCVLGDLGPGGAAQMVIGVTPEGTGVLIGIGAVEGGDGSVTPIESSTPVGDGQPGVDLQVTVMVDPDPGQEGVPMTYTVYVGNAGTETAEGVDMALDFDGVPVSIDSVEPAADCIVSATGVSCQLGDIAAGDVAQMVTVVTPQGTGTLVVSGVVEDADGNMTPISATTVITEFGDDDIFSDRFEQ